MSESNDEAWFVLAMGVAAVFLVLNTIDAWVDTDQYEQAVEACKDAQGLDHYKAGRWCSGACIQVENIHCNDGRVIDEWPILVDKGWKHPKTGYEDGQ